MLTAGIVMIIVLANHDPVRITATVEANRFPLSRQNSLNSQADAWYLILVNPDHPIPDDYQVQLLTLSNGEQIDTRIYQDLQAMFDDARAEGLALFVRNGYRTFEEQQELYDEKVNAFIEEGCSAEEAIQQAEGWVAIPGTSEHQLGLSVDINPDLDISSIDEVYSWLEDNSYKYGFVKRYPSEKADITGINDEPWHFRYVGHEAAEEMFIRGLCLEEYLGNIEKTELTNDVG